MKKIILLLIIFIQLLIIGVIFKDIQKKSVLGITSLNHIQKDTLITSGSGKLRYFYEPKPNTIIKPDPIFPGLENVSYHINNDGLNQIEDYSVNKDRSIYRIVTIGDSFTFGQNVNTEDNYPSQLNQILNERLSCPTIKKFEVINLGVEGYDIQYTVERFKKRGVKYHPDLVIWLFIEDDLKRIDEMIIPKADKYRKEAKENGTFEKYMHEGNYYFYWIKARDQLTATLGEDKVLEIQKEYMKQLNDFYTGNLLLVTFPIIELKHQKFLKEYSKERKNTFFYSQLPIIYIIENATLPDQHPSKKGHELITNALLSYLLEKQLLNCSLK